MARTQGTIYASIWGDEDFTVLSAGAQRIYMLLVTQPKLSLAGSLDYHPARWARYAPDTTAADIEAAIGELEAHRFVVVDDDELVLRTFVANDLARGAVNRNLVKGMWSAWEAIGSRRLRKVIVDEMPEAVWGRDGVDRPAKAEELRFEPRLELPFEPRFPTVADQAQHPDPAPEPPAQEPRSEPRFEPQFEPSVDCSLLSADCSPLPGSTSGQLPSTPAQAPTEEEIENRIRRAASRVARHQAQADPTVRSVDAVVGTRATRLLDAHSHELRHLATTGATVDQLEAHLTDLDDPLTNPTPTNPPPSRPRPPLRPITELQPADPGPPGNPTTGLAAARAALGTEPPF